MSDDEDVPIRVDFRDAATARAWIEETRVKRPARPRFFAAFCEALVASPKPRILELGSGPGHLTDRRRSGDGEALAGHQARGWVQATPNFSEMDPPSIGAQFLV